MSSPTMASRPASRDRPTRDVGAQPVDRQRENAGDGLPMIQAVTPAANSSAT
jgi:hypothetical protein